MLLSCCCHVLLLSCCCHVVMLSCCCHVVVMLSSCCCHGVMLSYYHVISICFLHGKISYEKAENLYIKINKVKKYSSCHTFANKLDLSMDYFKENNLISILRLDHID